MIVRPAAANTPWPGSGADPRVDNVFVAPGNAGTATEAKCQNVAIDIARQHRDLIQFVQVQGIDLTIVGPEAPLVLGWSTLPRRWPEDLGARRNTPRNWKAPRPLPRISWPAISIPTADYQTSLPTPDAALAYVREKGAHRDQG
jgi:phosphoribosylamine--glycine ligase